MYGRIQAESLRLPKQQEEPLIPCAYYPSLPKRVRPGRTKKENCYFFLPQIVRDLIQEEQLRRV